MFQKVKSFCKKASLGASAALASGAAFATDHSAVINTSVTEGQANYELVIVGVISLAAIGFGISMIVSAMRT